MATWICWRVEVEDKYGIIAIHYVECYWADSARQIEADKGYKVLSVTQC